MVTALRSCNVRLEKRARELFYVARLILGVTEGKPSMKMRKSHGLDLKPDDLLMSKVKSLERGMEA